jgi:HEPN domain-containing protein
MQPPEKLKYEVARQWLQSAEEDLGVAQHLLSAKVPYSRAIGFHAQQAAEKFLKAYLTWNQKEFPKTHNLGNLLDLVAEINPPLADALRGASQLNPYAVETRYPSEGPRVSIGEAKQAMELAAKVRKRILEALKQEP